LQRERRTMALSATPALSHSADRERLLDLYADELKRYSDRSFEMSQSTLTIISAEVVVLTGGILAYEKYPIAFCLVPVAWTVWMFQSFVTDHDTLKIGVYVEWLEEQISVLAGPHIATWESRLAERGNPRRALIYMATYVTYILVNSTSWVFSIWILRRELGAPAAIAFSAVWAGVLIIAHLNQHNRERYLDRYRQALRNTAGLVE
jgi:hypothetical protein